MAFKPLFSIGSQTVPGAITDPKGLMGGTATTGGNPQIAAAAVVAGAAAGAAAGLDINSPTPQSTGQPGAGTQPASSPSGTDIGDAVSVPLPSTGSSVANGNPYTQGGYTQQPDGTWQLNYGPDDVRAEHGG